MTAIRSMGNYLNSFWDWECLAGAFGESQIRPMDIDGLVERNGCVLFIEAKGLDRNGKPVPVPQGQLLALQALSKLPRATVFIVWGEPGYPKYARVMSPTYTSGVFECDLPSFWWMTAKWYRQADKNPYQAVNWLTEIFGHVGRD